MIQDFIVTAVACGAAAVILLRVTGIARQKKAGCDSCGTSQQSCTPAKPDAARANVHPLKIHLARKP